MKSNRFLSSTTYHFIFIFLCFTGLNLQAQENNQEWTLQDCINHALDNNLDIQQANLDLEDSEVDQSDALGNYLPSVNFQADNSWNSGLTQDVTTGILEQQTTRNLSLNATANIPIFNGLKNLRSWQRAKLTKLASEYSLDQMEDDILLNVTNAYLNVLVNKENLNVLKEQNEVTQEQLNDTRIKIEEGAAPAGDSLDILAADANEKQQIIQAENDVKITLINLAQILQIDDYQNFDIADADYDVPIETILAKSPQEIINNAKETRSEIKLAESRLELAEKDVELARADRLPELNGFVNFNTRESGANRAAGQEIDPDNPTEIIGQVESTGEDVIAPNYVLHEVGPRPFFKQLSQNKGWSYGLRLNIPILNGFSTRNSVKRSKIDVDRNKNELRQTELDLESNVYQAYVDAQGAAEAYQAAKVALNAQEKSYEYSEDRYDVGKITSFEFSQAKFDLADTESKLINAKFDYIFKLKVLELYFGVEPDEIRL